MLNQLSSKTGCHLLGRGPPPTVTALNTGSQDPAPLGQPVVIDFFISLEPQALGRGKKLFLGRAGYPPEQGWGTSGSGAIPLDLVRPRQLQAGLEMQSI